MIHGKCSTCNFTGGSANYFGLLEKDALEDAECPVCNTKTMVAQRLPLPDIPWSPFIDHNAPESES